MKKIIALLTVCVLVFTACEKDTVTATPEEIFTHLKEEGAVSSMLDIGEDRLSAHNINPDDAVSFVAKESELSFEVIQVIIIKAKKGKADTVYAAMAEHQEKLRDLGAYPQAKEAAANSVVGMKGDLVYLICHKDAPSIEKKLLKFVG